MSKYQEALDEVGVQVNKAYIDSCYGKATKQSMRKVEDIVGVNIKILQELVEKATPMKPDKYVLLERDYLGFPTHGYCKKCGNSLLVKNNYCGRCGQALDWGKDDGR